LKELENSPTEIKEEDEKKIRVLQEAHKREIQALLSAIEVSKNKVSDFEKKLNDINKSGGSNENLVKFKVHFDGIVSNFKVLLSDVSEIDEDNQIKYREAVKGLLNKMIETI